MSFKESVILPYSLFKKCQFAPPEKLEHENILRDSTLPSDLKMKLYSQSKALSTKPTPEPEKKKADYRDENAYILQLMPEKDQPFISSILTKIAARKDEIHWNTELELNIDGKPYPGSNIIELLKFVVKNLIITSDIDVPIGAKDFVNKLYDIGVPKTWIKVSFPRRMPKRKKVKSTQRSQLSDSDTDDSPQKFQKGQGIPWLVY